MNPIRGSDLNLNYYPHSLNQKNSNYFYLDPKAMESLFLAQIMKAENPSLKMKMRMKKMIHEALN